MAIVTYWPNASAQHIVAEVTRVIEGAISNIDGITQLNSVSEKNISTVNIEISPLFDIDNLRLNILQILRRLYKQLPDGVYFPQINQTNKSFNRKALIIYSACTKTVEFYEMIYFG